MGPGQCPQNVRRGKGGRGTATPGCDQCQVSRLPHLGEGPDGHESWQNLLVLFTSLKYPDVPVGDHLSPILSLRDSGGLIILPGSMGGHETQDWPISHSTSLATVIYSGWAHGQSGQRRVSSGTSAELLWKRHSLTGRGVELGECKPTAAASFLCCHKNGASRRGAEPRRERNSFLMTFFNYLDPASPEADTF